MITCYPSRNPCGNMSIYRDCNIQAKHVALRENLSQMWSLVPIFEFLQLSGKREILTPLGTKKYQSRGPPWTSPPRPPPPVHHCNRLKVTLLIMTKGETSRLADDLNCSWGRIHIHSKAALNTLHFFSSQYSIFLQLSILYISSALSTLHFFVYTQYASRVRGIPT